MSPRAGAVLAGLALAVGGCGKPPRPYADCEIAIGKGMFLSVAELRRPGMTPALREDMRHVALSRCKADRWPEPVLTCMVAAGDPPDFEACLGRVPAKDLDRLVREAAALMPRVDAGGSAAPRHDRP